MTVSDIAGVLGVSLADVCGWLLVAVLLCLLAVAALLVVVFEQAAHVRDLRERLRHLRGQRDRAQASVARLQVNSIRLGFDLGDLQGRYEALADAYAADRLLIDEFIPGGFNADDFKDLS